MTFSESWSEEAKDETRVALVRTRELLATPRQWTKGTYMRQRPEGPCYCLFGAMYEGCKTTIFAQDTPLLGHARVAVGYAIGSKLGTPDVLRNIMRFNDDPDTAHNDVLEVLDLAISALEPAPAVTP